MSDDSGVGKQDQKFVPSLSEGAFRSWLRKRRHTLVLTAALAGLLILMVGLLEIGARLGGLVRDLTVNVAAGLFCATVTVLLLESFLKRSADAVAVELRSIREEQAKLRAELARKVRSERQYLELLLERFRAPMEGFMPVRLREAAQPDRDTPLSQLGLESVRATEAPEVFPDIVAASTRMDRLVILGDPGSGKTANARYLAYQVGKARLDRLERDGSSAATRRHPIPLWIPVAEIDDGLERLLQEHWSRAGMVGELNAALESGSLWLFLDALDESPRARYSQVIAEIQHLLSRYPDTRVLITCRTMDYSVVLDAPAIVVERLTRNEAHQYVKKRARAWGLASPDQMIKLLDALPPLMPLEIELLAKNFVQIGDVGRDIPALFWRSALKAEIRDTARADDLLGRLSLLALSIQTANAGNAIEESKAIEILGSWGLESARRVGIVALDSNAVRFVHHLAYEYFLSRLGR
jgi:hypothetical protein